MKRLSATLLALGLAAAVGSASAQNYGGVQSGAVYDYARVLRVDPVIGNNNAYGNNTYGNNTYGNNTYGNNTYASNGQRCYESTGPNRYAGNNGYNTVAYPNDPYYPQQGRYGTDTGRTIATVVGGIAGAVLGSKVGGGSGQVAATAIGSMVGGLAGRQVYETSQRRRSQQQNTVTVCDDGYNGNGYNNNGYANNNGYDTYRTSGYDDGRVVGYDVTYEYAGRQYVTRTNYHPGDRIRVRVDVRPE